MYTSTEVGFHGLGQSHYRITTSQDMHIQGGKQRVACASKLLLSVYHSRLTDITIRRTHLNKYKARTVVGSSCFTCCCLTWPALFYCANRMQVFVVACLRFHVSTHDLHEYTTQLQCRSDMPSRHVMGEGINNGPCAMYHTGLI